MLLVNLECFRKPAEELGTFLAKILSSLLFEMYRMTGYDAEVGERGVQLSGGRL